MLRQASDDLAKLDLSITLAKLAIENNYCRPLIAEVMVQGDRFAIIRERQKIEDLIAQDKVPNWI